MLYSPIFCYNSSMTLSIQPNSSHLHSPADNQIHSPFYRDTLVTPNHPAAQSADAQLLGGKAAALARLYAAGFPVPAYVVVTTAGVRVD